MLKQLAFFFIVVMTGCSPASTDQKITDKDRAPDYDSALAATYGADDYGMKTYMMAFLKAGPNRSQDSAEAARLQKAHLDNIKWMAAQGDLVLAGPFLDADSVRGIYIFNVSTEEEARALTNTDPAIQAGRLKMELRPWYGSAALMELNTLHKKVQKQEF